MKRKKRDESALILIRVARELTSNGFADDHLAEAERILMSEIKNYGC